MKQALALVCYLSFYALLSEKALALDFSLHPNTTKNLTAVLATGEIKAGDVDRLPAFLRSRNLAPNIAIYLASPGGDLYEGMSLGLYFRQNKIKTVIEGGYDCASACALAFLGGTDNNGLPWRSSSTNSHLCFHAFRGSEGAPSTDDVQRVVADMLRYGKTVNAPIDLLIAGFYTPSNNIFCVSEADVCALGIKLWSNDTNRFVCN
jgi:hypothetical protein